LYGGDQNREGGKRPTNGLGILGAETGGVAGKENAPALGGESNWEGLVVFNRLLRYKKILRERRPT